MNKKMIILLGIVLLINMACSKISEEDQMEIATAISIIEQSLNTGDSAQFSKRSDMTNFYTFFSQLVTVAKKSGGDNSGVKIKPQSYKGTVQKANVTVSMDFNIDLKNLSTESDIPVETLQQIVAIGLPNQATFTMELTEGGYKLVAIKWPLKYFYMNLLIN